MIYSGVFVAVEVHDSIDSDLFPKYLNSADKAVWLAQRTTETVLRPLHPFDGIDEVRIREPIPLGSKVKVTLELYE